MNHRYIVKNIERTAQDVVVLDLSDERGRPVFPFKPGQYVMIAYRDASGNLLPRHSFSIASAPSDRERIQLGIKIGGKFTQGLAKLKPGTTVFVSGPFGDFTFNEKRDRDAVFIAGGIGITPFLSAMRHATNLQLSNRLSLIYGNKTIDGAPYLDEIHRLEALNKNIRMLYSFTGEKITIPSHINNIVTERISAPIVMDFIGSTHKKTFFICGPEGFMKAAKSTLLDIGVDPSQIFLEEFTMLPEATLLKTMRNFSYAVGVAIALMILPFSVIYADAIYKQSTVAQTATPTTAAQQPTTIIATPIPTTSASAPTTAPISAPTQQPTTPAAPVIVSTPAPAPAPTPTPAPVQAAPKPTTRVS